MKSTRNEFKYINFQRASETSNKSDKEQGKEVSKFYEELVKQPTKPADSDDDSDVQIDEAMCKPGRVEASASNRPPLKASSAEFFRSAQDDNLKVFKQYVEEFNWNLTAVDDYQWNVLMIAISAKSDSVIEYILTEIKDLTLVKFLIINTDQSGNSAISLAKRFSSKALQLIRELDQRDRNKIEENVKLDKTTTPQNNKTHCDTCGGDFDSAHFSSIAHLLNENKSELPVARRSDYQLRSSNKGYQMMLNMGWNESGLGSSEQGRINPVRAKVKLDRLGVGVDKSEASVSDSRGKKRRSGDAELLRQAKTNPEKTKQLERELRSYFNS